MVLEIRGRVEKATGRPECCFWVMLSLVAVCLVWLHAIVSGMRRRSSIRFDAVSMEAGDQIGAGA